MAISGISASAPRTISAPPAPTQSAGQSAFSKDVSSLQQSLLGLQSGEGAGKAHKSHKSHKAGQAGQAGQSGDAGQAGQAGQSGNADMSQITQMLQKIVQLLQGLLSKLQGTQGSTQAPGQLPTQGNNIDVAPGLSGNPISDPSVNA